MRVSTVSDQLFFITTRVTVGTSRGTALIMQVELPGGSVPMLISNKHVVMHPGDGEFALTRKDSTGNPVIGDVHVVQVPDMQNHWVGHPDPEVDIAVASLGELIRGRVPGEELFYRALSLELFPSDEVAGDFDAIEPVVFVGYPQGLMDYVNQMPIARRGFTATPMTLPYNGMPAFLIDASVFPGSSGSPVFVHHEFAHRASGGWSLGQEQLFFVGLVAQVHIHTSAVIATTGAPTGDLAPAPMDLGIVFNWHAVRSAVENFLTSRGLNIVDALPSPKAEPIAG